MALPRIVAATARRKTVLNDGNVNVAFKVVSGEDVGIRGYARLVMTAAAAADFDVDTEYTLTLTAGD